MSFNPFLEKAPKLDATFENWKQLAPKPYDKNEVDPFTKTRIILMNGTEYEAVGFSHHFHRHCNDNDLRRELAVVRRIEQQQQKKIAALKPIDEDILEHTIGYEQLAVDLTAIMAQNESDKYVKAALDFALLEDFDHLYRYADLLEMEHGVRAERLVGSYTEIMPGRPTISEHRYPVDDVRRHIDNKKASLLTKLHASIITAAEQQTMNYYMNQGAFYTSERGRKLYTEIAMIEEQHVTQYGSLIDTNVTMLECMLMHEYTECYLYYSCYMDETDKNVKKIWEEFFTYELAHLHKAAELLKKYEKKEWEEVIPGGEFPKLLKFSPNVEYIRKVLKTVNITGDKEDYVKVCDLKSDSRFFKNQRMINTNDDKIVASHMVIEDYLKKNEEDYRFETAKHPVPELRDRNSDNVSVGRECE